MSTNTKPSTINTEVDEIDPSEMWTEQERDAYFEDLEESPLMMGSFSPEDVKNNTNFQALESIIKGDQTNEELVEDFQHEAKKSFAQGNVMYSKAYTQFKKAIFYCEKLEKTSETQHLLATLYGNCALIQMKKENFRSCLKDCNAALALDPHYKKVLYRKAKSLAGLNNYHEAVACCNLILEEEPDNTYTMKLREECEKHVEKNVKRSEEIARNEQKKEEERQFALATINHRQYQIGPTLYEYPKSFDAAIHVKNEEIIFPVLFLYPESNQSDYIREMSELDTFNDVIHMLFPTTDGKNTYLSWDEERQYTADNVEIWLQEYLVLPYPTEGIIDVESLRKHNKTQRKIRVNQNYTLGDILRYEKYIIPGIPVFNIYARNACRSDFYKGQKDQLLQLVNRTTTRSIHRCQHCGEYEKDTVEYKKCSSCKKAFYCSRECQMNDWKTHKYGCKTKKE